jgi:hypothetical protein
MIGMVGTPKILADLLVHVIGDVQVLDVVEDGFQTFIPPGCPSLMCTHDTHEHLGSVVWKSMVVVGWVVFAIL